MWMYGPSVVRVLFEAAYRVEVRTVREAKTERVCISSTRLQMLHPSPTLEDSSQRQSRRTHTQSPSRPYLLTDTVTIARCQWLGIHCLCVVYAVSGGLCCVAGMSGFIVIEVALYVHKIGIVKLAWLKRDRHNSRNVSTVKKPCIRESSKSRVYYSHFTPLLITAPASSSLSPPPHSAPYSHSSSHAQTPHPTPPCPAPPQHPAS